MSGGIEIKSGHWSAMINPKHGANVERLMYDGKDVYFPVKSNEDLKQNPYTHGSPILLPANRTAHGRFEFRGREYFLGVNESKSGANLHGCLHDKEFSTLWVHTDSVCLEYVNRGFVYPFDFVLRAEYVTDGQSFLQKYSLTNTGSEPMPYTFGLHTTFCEPQSFKVPVCALYERDGACMPTGKLLPLDKDKSLYRTGAKSRSNAITGYYKADGNKACIDDFEYEFSENFNTVILYNGEGKSGFLCIEPQCGLVNGLNIKDGFSVLEPGKTDCFYTRLRHI